MYPGTKEMRANITFNEIANELYNIFSDDRTAAAYMADGLGPQYIGLCGWAGAMSPANRAAFVATFGRDMTTRAEDQARARVAEYRAAVESSTYHAAELEADAWQAVYGDPEKSQAPEVGAFVWGRWSCLKGEDGPLGELEDLERMEADGDEIRRRLCEVVAVVDASPAEFMNREFADGVARQFKELGGSRYEESDPLRLDGHPMSWELVFCVRCAGRWYLIDGQGYNYTRYFLMPEEYRRMYAAELATITAAREDEERRQKEEAQRQADARRADYLARCARWAPLMEDVRPLIDAERAAYDTREKSQIRKASAKLSAARRRNLVAMASALYPGVKFSAKKWDGWGGSYELTWTDGPTVDHLEKAGDFRLFERSRDVFNGYDDSSDVIRAEFVDFADKYFDLGGQINFRREVSDEYRQSIADRIRAAVPGLPEGDQEPIKDNGQQSAICGMFREVGTSYLCDMLDRYGLREAVGYIARSMDAPQHQDEPTDPNGGGSPAPSYGDGEKSQLQDAPTVEGVEVVGYSEKALAVFGDTRALADELKAIGAKFNRALSYNGERRAGWIISRRKADELAAVLALPQGQEEETQAEGATAPALPEPPAAVVYDPSQPIESAEFVAVDADGAPYGEGEKSQILEAVEVTENPDVKEYRLMYLFGAWVCHSRVYAETDGEAIEDATDDYLTSTLPRWPYRVALWNGSRLVHEFKGDGPDDIGRRDMEQEESEKSLYQLEPIGGTWPTYSGYSILSAAGQIVKSEQCAGDRHCRLFMDGVKIWDSEENTKILLAAIVRAILITPYGDAEKSPVPYHLADIYQRAKAKSAEAVALFHCGDWFTAYGEDADRVADAVGIIITTTREGFRKASFPFAALDTYLPRMVRQGIKVCICEAPRQAEPSRLEKVAQEV